MPTSPPTSPLPMSPRAPRRAALRVATLLALGAGGMLAQTAPPSIPAQPTPIQPTSVQPTSVQPTSVQPTPVQTSMTLTLSGPEVVVIGVPARLALARRAGALTLQGGSGVTWTSSAPAVVSVDGGGQLTALRLSAAPVVITVSSGGVSASRAVSSAGLELTVGTFNFSPGTPGARVGAAALLRLRLPPGVTLPASSGSLRAEVSGPLGHLPAGLDPDPASRAPGERSGWSADPSRAALPGRYHAEVSAGGVTYRAQALLSAQDAAHVMPPLRQPTLSVRGAAYILGGAAAQPGQAVQVALFGPAQTFLAPAQEARRLPAPGHFQPAPAAGHYTQGVLTLNSAPFPAAGELTPPRFEMAWTDLGVTDIP